MLTVLALLAVSSQPAIVCAGAYPQHLQGVAMDSSGYLYWSFTTVLVKTDSAGSLIQKIDVESHHGDVCVVGDRLYCAVNKGRFNNPAGRADNWIAVYDTADLVEIGRKPAPTVVYGAGGIASDGKRFIVVGGLPLGHEVNPVFEFDGDLDFRRSHMLASGWTSLGIQTATFADGRWWFGCYGDPPQLLSTDSSFGDLVRSEFDCSLGLVPVGDGTFLAARDTLVPERGHVGSLVSAVLSGHGQLSLESDE